MWLKENPNPKLQWGQWHFEPSSFPRTEQEEFSHWLCILRRIPPWRFQSRDLELCLAAHKLPALPSHLLYGCWQHKPTFFLATSPEPLCDAGPMSRNLSAPQSQFFFPPTFPGCSEQRPRETARPRSLTHSLCAQEDLRGLSQHKWFHGSKWRDVTVQLIQTVTDSSHSQDSCALRLERHFQNKEQNTITDGKQRFFFFFSFKNVLIYASMS